MKKLIFTLFVTIIAFSGMAQTIGDAFFVYRNDGKFNAFLREEVDSIVYSYYDADSIRFDEVVSQIVFTKDSAYWIPLAAIDSVAFVTPQTVYQDDVVNLDGRLFDYVSFTNGMSLSLSKATPHDLLPKTGEKLVALKLSEKFPYGFLGKVVNISENDSNILITCDSISLEDAVKRFFGTINVVSTDENDNIPKSRARDISSDSWQQTFVINTIKIPFDFSGVVKKKDIINFAGKAKGDFYFTPKINIRLTIAIDETILLSYYNIHAVTDFEAKEELEVGGEAKGEEKIPFEALGKDFLLPYGFTYYFSPGLKFSVNGEFAVGATFTQTGRHTMDITYYPLLSLASGIGTLFNSIDQDIKLLSSELDWHYIVGRVTYKGGIFIETGFGFLNHKIIKVGGEFDFGLEFKADFKFDWDMLKSADRNTTLYETIQNSDRVDICPFIGLRGITAIADERIKFSVGKDWDAPWNSFLLKRRILPSFYNVSAQREDLTSASVSSGITNDCLLPMKVGFSVFNSKGEKLWTQYNDQLYSNRLFSFSNFGASFNNLNHLGKYTIYPVISLFGYDMIASPSAEIEIEAKPITLNAVNIEETSAEVFGKIEGYEMIDENVTYGIGYTTEGEGGSTLFNAMNYLGGGVFSVKLIALKPNTTYNYYAYLIVDGEMICGEIKQFTTSSNAEPYLVRNGNTLTFYYDNLSKSRNGMSINRVSWKELRENIETIVFDISFANCKAITSTYGWFRGYKNLKDIIGIEYLNTANVTDMTGMFYDCSALRNLDLSNFNTSKVTSMWGMFVRCSSLTSLNLSNFNTSNVTEMYGMFDGCSSLTSLDLSSFNTEKVVTMGYMFSGCSSLTSIDLSSFNTSNLTDSIGMIGMFENCGSLTNLDLSNFNTAKVLLMTSVFEGCSSLTSLDISSFNTSNVTNMARMFYNCRSLTSIDLRNFDTSNVDDMEFMFCHCESLKTLDLSSFNTANLKKISDIFWYCDSLTSLDCSNFIITDNIRNIFHGRKNLKHIDLSNVNTSDLTDMSGMFYGCGSLISLDLSSFDTANVTNMESLFSGCYSLTSINLKNFNTAKVTNMKRMFIGCSSLTSINLENFDTSNVTDMESMFYGCRSLTNLDINNFDTANVTDMKSMFLGCSSLTNLDLSGLKTANVKEINDIFDYCESLKILNLSNLDFSGLSDFFVDIFFLPSSLEILYFDNAHWGGHSFFNFFAEHRLLTKVSINNLDAPNLTDMSGMFENCSSLTSVGLSNLYAPNLTHMYRMFMKCSSLTSVDLSNLNAPNLTDMSYMFNYCSSLTSVNLNSYNTTKVTDMSYMFYDCSSLTSVDMSSFNTPDGKKMNHMFSGCSSLKTIYAGNWRNDSQSSFSSFRGCYNLTGGKGTKIGKNLYGYVIVDNTSYPLYYECPEDSQAAHIDGGKDWPGLFTAK